MMKRIQNEKKHLDMSQDVMCVCLNEYSIDLQKIQNRRFMYHSSGWLILGAEDMVSHEKLLKSHAEEYHESVKLVQGTRFPKYDDFIRGWIGIGGDYQNGIIHFAPVIPPDNIEMFEQGFSFIEAALENGLSYDAILRGFPGPWEQPIIEVIPEPEKENDKVANEDMMVIFEKVALKVREEIEKAYGSGTDLCGKCIEASERIVEELKKEGVEAVTVEGWCVYDDECYGSDHPWDEHTWVEVPEMDLYIDVTADQFNYGMYSENEFPSVIVRVGLPSGMQYEEPYFIMGLDDWNVEEVKGIVEQYVREKLSGAECEGVEVVGIELYGSRTYGGALEGSDLDVVVEFRGEIREDTFFDVVHDEDDPLFIEGIEVDINPITEGKSGTLEEFMERVKDFRKREADGFRKGLDEQIEKSSQKANAMNGVGTQVKAEKKRDKGNPWIGFLFRNNVN